MKKHIGVFIGMLCGLLVSWYLIDDFSINKLQIGIILGYICGVVLERKLQ